ncbi:MAG TPA: DUF6109 family natural product biosynthesis protein [Polyangia bacterium]|nr:DUF6109 family natural product biosynthesis protein [Polyangia bacterium]
MSRRESRVRHIERRIHEELARGDVVGVTTRLLHLPAPERAPFMGAVARMVRGEIAQAQAQATWHQLTYWAARYEREPGLVEAGASDGEGLAAHWALFWGCARAGEWRRAGEHWAQVREPFSAQAPELAQALSQYVEGLGNFEPLFGPELSSWVTKTSLPGKGEDPRGTRSDVRSSRRLPPPPTSLEEIEPALLECYRTAGFSRFQNVVLDWLPRVPAVYQRTIRRLAVPLAVRTQLERITTPALNDRWSWVPAAFASRLLCEEAAPPELAEEALLLFRMLSAELARRIQKEESLRDELHALVSVAEAAMLYPQHRRLVEAALTRGPQGDLSLTIESIRLLLPLFERLLRIEASVPLWRRALQLWYAAHELEHQKVPPRWLDETLERLLKTPEKWIVWLRTCDPEARAEDLVAFSDLLSVPLCADLVDVLWGAVGTAGGADADLGVELSQMVLHLLERQQRARRGPAGSSKMSQRLLVALAAERGFDLSELPEQFIQFALNETPQGREIQRQLEDAAPIEPDELDDAERALWARFRERVLPYDVDFLEIALCEERSPAKRKQLVARFLGPRNDIEVQLKLLRDAYNEERARAQNALERYILEQHAVAPASLARGLKVARDQGAPLGLQRQLATALLAAVAHVQTHDNVMETELAYARRLVKPPRRRTTKSPKAPRGKARGQGSVQLELPTGEKPSRSRQKGQR